MKLNTHPDKLSLFWVLQISGWLLYGIIYYLIYYSHRDLDAANILGFAITYIVAFLVTLVMRKIYQKVDYQHQSMLNVSAIVRETHLNHALVLNHLNFLKEINFVLSLYR